MLPAVSLQVEMRVVLTNTGSALGAETVQLYLTYPFGAGQRARLQCILRTREHVIAQPCSFTALGYPFPLDPPTLPPSLRPTRTNYHRLPSCDRRTSSSSELCNVAPARPAREPDLHIRAMAQRCIYLARGLADCCREVSGAGLIFFTEYWRVCIFCDVNIPWNIPILAGSDWTV